MSAGAPVDGHAGLSESNLRWVLDRLPGAVLVVDRALVVRYRNLAAIRLVHPDPLRAGERLPEVDWEPSLRELGERLVSHRIVAEAEIRLPDDRVCVFAGQFHDTSGLGVIELVDVGARVRRRRAGEDFVVNAAHEFLSPLTAIAGAAHVLREGPDAEPEVRDRFLGHISEATDRLIAISRALLVLARAEAGIEPPRLDIVPLRPLLDEVAAASTRKVSVECPDGATVLTDADLLRQAIWNLVDNARRHSTGEIAVSVEEFGAATLRIEVADSGAGILPEHVDRVTDRFFSGAGRDSGFGIGLSIAARSLDVVGGTLLMRSGRTGTHAIVQLPSAR